MEKLTKHIIKALHKGKDYEEALQEEMNADMSYPEGFKVENELLEGYGGLPISLARILAVVQPIFITRYREYDDSFHLGDDGGKFMINVANKKIKECKEKKDWDDFTKITWQLTEKGRELYLDSQTDETKMALLKLFESK